MSGAPELFNFIPVSWVGKARCRGMDPNIFMPDLGAPTEPIKEICNGKQTRVFNRARQVYETVGDPPCPVRDECLAYALELPGKVVGIFGGTSEKERRALKSSMRNAGAIKRIKHGTLSGYKSEWSFGLKHCEPCRAANAKTTQRSRDQARTRIKHGTYAGYRAEKRLRLPICEPCTFAYHQEKQQHLKKTTHNEQDSPLKQIMTLVHSITTAKWPIAKDIANESTL